MNNNRIIIPLDGMNEAAAMDLAAQLKGLVWGFKVNDLLIECGIDILRKLQKYGSVFADAKLHDIPNTVKNGVSKLLDAGADLITVHSSGGTAMLEAAAKVGGSSILAVTVLTSLDDNQCKAVYGKTPIDAVIHLAKLAADSGIHGIVCSPKELTTIETLPNLAKLTKVVPGIRPNWYGKTDDQSRIATPKEALANGANLLVIGRPITQSSNPMEAAQRINNELL